MPDATTEKGQVRPFAAVLQEISKGAAHHRLSEDLATLVAAVKTHDKKGSMTITVSVEPNGDALTVTVTHVTKLPQPALAGTFFSDDAGNLTRSDPRQPSLPISLVPARVNEGA